MCRSDCSASFLALKYIDPIKSENPERFDLYGLVLAGIGLAGIAFGLSVAGLNLLPWTIVAGSDRGRLDLDDALRAACAADGVGAGNMGRIAESELIINDRGAIYHLNLLPEELAHNIIVVGDPDRVKMVSKYFDKIEVNTRHREFVTHTGAIGKKRISVISTGIGTDNIDIVVNELDALVNIDLDSRK